MFSVGDQDDPHMVRITAKDDHWSDLAAEERQRNAIKRRRELDVVDRGRVAVVRAISIHA